MNRKQYGKRFPLRPFPKPPIVINTKMDLDPAKMVAAINQAKRMMGGGGLA
jgi:hypothetical protein